MLVKSLGIIDECISEIRTICKSLVPPSLGEVSLKESLEALTLPLKLADMSTRLIVHNMREDDLSDALKISVYRIVQEQLNNIIKHSSATNVIVCLRQKPGKLLLKIEDDGVGFDPNTKKSGIGITNILNRSNTFNGKAVIDSSPGKGCRLHISFSI
jgi:signal transduction histidine kinase